jgi:hypothetical protein
MKSQLETTRARQCTCKEPRHEDFLPGPWFIGRRRAGDRSQPIVNGKSIIIAEVFGIFDGRLIAASPEMYRAVCALDRVEVRKALEQSCGKQQADEIFALVRQARAKVEGEDAALYRPDL